MLAVWRYAGYLMGIPETILYTTGDEATKTYKIGYLCEPSPDADSVAVANLLIQSIPKVADVQDEAEHKRLVELAYRLSRALIGKPLADSFEFPPDPKVGDPVQVPDAAARSAIVADQQDGQIGQLHPASPDIGVRQRGAELQNAGPRLHVEIKPVVTIA